MASIEVKIKKLDGELARYKEQMGRLRNGPGKVCTIRAIPVALGNSELTDRPSHLSHNRNTCMPRNPVHPHAVCLAECNPGARAADIEAEADVRVAARAAHATDVQHGVGCARDRESTEHNGDCRCDEAGEQGA